MEQQLSRKTLQKILQSENIEALSVADLIELFRVEEGITNYVPDGICQIDPRSGERILYNSARARRPHDNRPAAEAMPELDALDKDCLICQGQTTGVIDVAPLSEGFTFINKNLFPALFPANSSQAMPPGDNGLNTEGRPAYGFHFLQWTSSLHRNDWHNMPLDDRVTVLERLAALEKKLLSSPAEAPGYLSIIKNYGHLVGGSLLHGHQQIGFSNVMPRRIRDNWRFEQTHGQPFSAYLQQENPAGLLLRDYGAALLLVPYFMRRPFEMMLLLKDTARQYLHQLTQTERQAVADGWQEAIRLMRRVMPQIGRETAYNVVTHTGPGAGLYFEFLPYTQEMGGFEHLGLFVCQGNPQGNAAQLREFMLSGE